jgi:large subunit ribosomal protein L24
MKIKVGDNVIVISGSRKDKNKQGKVLKTFKENSAIVVEGVNLKKKVTRDIQGKKALTEMEFPINVSNVKFFDATAEKGTRIGYKVDGDKKIRVAKASGTELK